MMMISMKSNYKLLIVFFLLIFWGSCTEEENEIDYNPNVKSSRDYIYAEDIFFEIINIYFKGITDPAVLDSNYKYIDNCAITLNPAGSMMTFSYGTVNRWCPDNKYRRGSFRAHFNSGPFEPGTTVTFSIDSLFVDDDQVAAEMSSAFLEPSGTGEKQFSFTIDSGQVILFDTVESPVILYNASFLFTWAEGEQTPGNHDDDLLLVTGSSGGISKDNVEFQVTVQEPLEDYLDCFWITAGTHQITTPSATTNAGIIDYITEDGCNYEVDFYFGESYFYDFLKH